MVQLIYISEIERRNSVHDHVQSFIGLKKKIPFDFVKWKIEKEKNGKNHDHTKNTMKYV